MTVSCSSRRQGAADAVAAGVYASEASTTNSAVGKALAPEKEMIARMGSENRTERQSHLTSKSDASAFLKYL